MAYLWYHVKKVKTVLYLLSGFLLLSFFIFLYVYTVFFYAPARFAEVEVGKAYAGVASRLEFLQKEGDAVAKLPKLIDAIITRDSYDLLGLLVSERDSRGIGLMGVTNENGYILSRTRTVNARGDNVFLTSPLGRALAGGLESGASVEFSDFNPEQVFFTSGRFVYHDGKRIGALFSNFLADDKFATRFRDEFMSPESQVVFYTRHHGVYGSSISDPGSRGLVTNFIHPNSRLIKDGLDNVRIRLADGRQFIIRNIVFPGLEASPGGMLIFVPIKNDNVMLGWLLSVPLLFFIIVIIVYKIALKKRFSIQYGLISFGLGIFIFVITWAWHTWMMTGLPMVLRVPDKLYNSTLRLQPEVSITSSQYERNVNIVVDSGGEAVNAFAVHIKYDPKILAVMGISTGDSLCTHVITQSIDAVNGYVHFECILNSPGFSGKSGIVASMRVRGIEQGPALLSFEDNTQVLANDGLGTNVLRSTEGGTIYVDDSVLLEKPSDTFTIYSSSHPNMEEWYANRTVKLIWLPNNVSQVDIYQEGFAGHMKVQELAGQLSPFKYTVNQDGRYRFVAKHNNKESAYYVNVDTTPPEKINFQAAQTVVKKDDTIRFQLSASDEGSGLQKTAYIKIDNNVFYPFKGEVYVPFNSLGRHLVTVRVYDRADNFAEKSIDISVVDN